MGREGGGIHIPCIHPNPHPATPPPPPLIPPPLVKYPTAVTLFQYMFTLTDNDKLFSVWSAVNIFYLSFLRFIHNSN